MGRDAMLAHHQFEKLADSHRLQRRPHVIRGSGTQGVAGDCGGSAGGTARVRGEHLSACHPSVFAEDAAISEPGQLDVVASQHREELLDRDTEQAREGTRIHPGMQVVVLIDDAREVGDDDGATVVDIVTDVLRAVSGDQVLRGDDDQLVAGQCVDRAPDVARHAELREGGVPPAGLRDHIDVDARMVAEFIAPPRIGVVNDGHRRRGDP